jgi:hypothetical protein
MGGGGKVRDSGGAGPRSDNISIATLALGDDNA